MIPSLSDLRIVPLDRLILHEAHDDSRLARLRERVQADEVQRHPVIVSPFEQDYLVLDGAHRVQALRDLNCQFILTQLVEPPARAESWGHVLEVSELRGLYGIEGIEISKDSGGSWLADVEFSDGKRLPVRVSEESLKVEIRALWSLQKLYPKGGVVHRVDPEAPIELDEKEAIIRYRPFTPEELVEVVRSGSVLPAGITRFRARERVLGVRFPLGKLKDGDEDARNEELREFVRRHWEQNRVRYYGEPVVLFE